MEICPLTGLPCPHSKCIHITDCDKNYKATNQKDLCALCGIGFVENSSEVDSKKAKGKIPQAVADILSFITKGKVPLQVVKATPVKSCSVCGFTLYDIAEHGKAGCSQCYEDFKKELLPLIIKCQNNSMKHKGKIPKNKVAPKTIEELELELKELIKKEDYENASKVRDEIKKLK